MTKLHNGDRVRVISPEEYEEITGIRRNNYYGIHRNLIRDVSEKYSCLIVYNEGNNGESCRLRTMAGNDLGFWWPSYLLEPVDEDDDLAEGADVDGLIGCLFG